PASPVGTAETGFSRASGTRAPGARDPRTEVLGYCRVVPPALPGLRGRRRCGECAPRTLHTYAAALPQIWIPPPHRRGESGRAANFEGRAVARLAGIMRGRRRTGEARE